MIPKLILFGLLLVGFYFVFAPKRGVSESSLSDAKSMVQSGALLLDVRTPQEFAAGHLPGARNVPVDELPSALGKLGDTSRGVVVYCRSGNRSARAADLLRSRGVDTVLDIGAMSNW